MLMPPKNTTLTRRSSRKKVLNSVNARRKPLTTSEPRLGAYGRKHPAPKLTPGHKRILRGTTSKKPRQASQGSDEHPAPSRGGFLLFCIKRVLTSGDLVLRDGNLWRLREDVVGVSSGEDFISLDACAQAMISSLEAQYRGESRSAA